MFKHLRSIASVVALCSASGTAIGQTMPTAFTYQGELTEGPTEGNGAYDVRFRLLDNAVGGVQIGATLCADNVSVINGRFAVSLDFGGSAYTNRPLFLEIEVRKDTGLDCANAAGFTVLGPRQAIAPTPYARLAADAVLLEGQPASFYLNAANISSGVFADARLSSNVPRLNASGTFSGNMTFTGAAQFSAASGTFSGTGTGLTGLSAGNIASGTLADARLASNIARLNASGTFTGNMSFSGSTQFQTASFISATGTFSGTGTGLTALNATNIASGTLADARLTTNIPRLNATLSTFSGNMTVGGTLQAQAINFETPAVRRLFISPGELVGNLSASFADPPSATNASTVLTGSATAAIHLPDGAVITELRVFMIDDATADMQFLLLRRPLMGTAGGTIASIDTSSVSRDPAVRVMNDVSISGGTIDNFVNQYLLRVVIAPTSVGDLEFRGAVITYTVASPLP